MEENEITSFDGLLEDPNNAPASVDQMDNGGDMDSLLEDPSSYTDDGYQDDNASATKQDETLLVKYLRAQGIDDPANIAFEGDDGEIERMNFNDLSEEEQLNMLGELNKSNYSDYEKEVINYLRTNNATLDQVVDYFAEQRLREYIDKHKNDNYEREYSVDDYNDDELYLADLKARFSTLTDEELVSKLDMAKADPELFQKEVDALRESYKQQEDAEIEYENQRMYDSYQNLQNSIIGMTNNFNEFPLDNDGEALQVEDQDKRAILQYLFDVDAEGKSQLVKDIQDPRKLIKLAWYQTNGDQMMTGLTRYWKDQLAQERAKSRKLEEQISRMKGDRSFVAPRKDDDRNERSIGSIWDKTNLI